MELNRLAAQRAFAAYVRDYDPQDPKIRLKIAHTYRVAALCEQIAKSLDFCGADTDLAWLSGLLHDIGRFEQVRRFGTFNDSLSVDHAALGADILFVQGSVRLFVPDPAADALLETAIRQHNVYRLREGLSAREKAFCELLRDADKVDILRVNCETPLTDIYNVTQQALRSATVSPAVMENFAQCRATPRALRQTPVDNVAALTSLAFELVYPYSRQAVQSQGYLDQLLHFASDNPETLRQFGQLRAVMQAYLADHGGQADVPKATR